MNRHDSKVQLHWVKYSCCIVPCRIEYKQGDKSWWHTLARREPFPPLDFLAAHGGRFKPDIALVMVCVATVHVLSAAVESRRTGNTLSGLSIWEKKDQMAFGDSAGLGQSKRYSRLLERWEASGNGRWW